MALKRRRFYQKREKSLLLFRSKIRAQGVVSVYLLHVVSADVFIVFYLIVGIPIF